MEVSGYVAHVSADGRRALAAGRDRLDTPVPSCPAWTVANLLTHLGRVHRWVEQMVRTGASERAKFPEPPPEGELDGWYEDGLAMLLRTLEAADPDQLVWNWMARTPAPARFWPRRMAHETAVHRWDSEHAAGQAGPIDAALATDGIEEYLDIVSFVLKNEPASPQLSGTLGLQSSDTGFARTLALSPTTFEQSEGTDGAQCTVRATASDLLLWMCGRIAAGERTVTVEGDPRVAEGWVSIHFA